MIYSSSILQVADNSGPITVQCIKVLSKSRAAHIGDTLVVTVQHNSSSSKFKKGQILKAILIRTKKGLRRPNGMRFFFQDNSVILLNHQLNLIGNRINGPVPRELRHFQQLKILSLAEEVV